jgi:cytochrome P450
VAFVLQGAGSGTQIMEIPEGIPRPRDVLAIADAPDHTKQRKLLNPQFNGPGLKRYQALVDTQADTLRESLAEEGTEWMENFAVPLPIRVISLLLGLPPEDYNRLKTWSDAGVAIIDGTATGDNLMVLATSILEFQGYLDQVLTAAVEAPGDNLLGKLALMMAKDDLDQDEAVSILLQVVVAGSESTSSLIGAMALRLADDPELQRLLREDSTKRQGFIDEVLRLDAPFRGHFRILNEPSTVGGIKMIAGTRLMLHWGMANRDTQTFETPEILDTSRTNARKHLGFGHGIHRCIGAGLARMESLASLRILLDELPPFRLKHGHVPAQKPSIFTNRLEDLHLVFQAT